MDKTHTFYIFLLSIILCGCTSSLQNEVSEYEESIDSLFADYDDINKPGATVAVVKDGEIVFKKGYGSANLEYNIPNSAATIFQIGSVSKQFTVFAILLLEKQGKLSLDDDIRKYMPEVPDFGKIITLRHLATHTSGLRDKSYLLSIAGWRMDDVITKEHVLKLVSKQKELNFNPGDEFSYSNTGFTLLAEVVSRVSDSSFAEFTKANIFEPLKMSNSFFYDDHEKIVKNRAYSYYTDSIGIKKSVMNYSSVGATGLFTTVEDLSRWSINFSNIKVGDATIINKMNTPAVLNNGETFGGALGQFVGEYKGLKEIQHGGLHAGYRSYLTRFPDEGLALVVLSNSAEFNPVDMAHKVLGIYLKDKIRVEPKMKEENPFEKITINQKILNTYVGDFELQKEYILTITEENSRLSFKSTGQPISTLIALSNTEFKLKDIEAKIEFVTNEENNVESIKIHQGGQIMNAPRIKKLDKTSVNLSEFSGEFYSEELSTTYNFNVVNGNLVAKHKRLSDFNLNLIKKDVFIGDTQFFGQIEFIRNNDAAVTGCKVSNSRVRNLFFEKVNKNDI